MTVKRVIKVLVIILILALMAAGGLYLLRYDRQDDNRMRNLYAQVEPLQKEKEALVSARDQLDSDYAVMMRDPATVQILFRELSDTLFSDAYPILRDRGIIGVIGLSIAQFPERHHMLTLDQYNHLLKDGWGSCYVFEKGYSLNSWLVQMEKQLERFQMEWPTAIFFPDNTYSEEMLDILRDHGVTTVILPGETGRAVVVTNVNEEFWFTVSMPWNYTGVNSDTELLAHTNGANLTYTVSFSNLWDAFDKSSFTSIVDSWEEMLEKKEAYTYQSGGLYVETETTEQKLEKPLIRPTTFEKAKESHLDAQSSENEKAAEIMAQKQELDAKIAQLDEQISAIYAQWKVGS